MILNACNSDDAGIKQAFFDAGASVYTGWSLPVDIERGLEAADRLVDHLLGSNTILPGFVPLMRPFDLFSLKPFLDDLGYTAFVDPPDLRGELVVTQNPLGGEFALLAPTIQRLYVDESSGALIIMGLFGPDPGSDGQVTVGGTPVVVREWLPYQITAELSPSGAGSAGAVVVGVRGTDDPLTALVFRKSNVARLSAWEGELRYTESGPGSLQEWMTYRFHVRGDVQATRAQPASAPERQPQLHFDLAPDVTAPYGALGEYQCSPEPEDSYLEAWSGGGTLPVSYDLSPGTFTGMGLMDLVARTGTILVGGGATFTMTVTANGVTTSAEAPLPWYAIGTSSGYAFTLSPSLGIEAGAIEQTMPRPICGGEQMTSRLEWDAMPLQFVPAPDDAR